MIAELLESAINEVSINERFHITEFQIGSEPMKLLIDEAKQIIAGFQIDISKILKYRDIPVTEHKSTDTVMFCINLKKKK